MKLHCIVDQTLSEGKRAKSRSFDSEGIMPFRVLVWRGGEMAIRFDVPGDRQELLSVCLLAVSALDAEALSIVVDAYYSPAEQVGSAINGETLIHKSGDRMDALLCSVFTFDGKSDAVVAPYEESRRGITWLDEIRHENAQAGGVIGEAITKMMKMPRREVASPWERTMEDIEAQEYRETLARRHAELTTSEATRRLALPVAI